MFYTYLWFRQNGTPYYVGKGSKRRAFTQYDHGVHRPLQDSRILVQEWSSEVKAFEMERWYIQLFGRKDKDIGILKNLTDGGEGSSGHKVSDSEKTRRSVQAKERWKDEDYRENQVLAIKKSHLGVHRDQATRDKISKSHTGRKKAYPVWNKGIGMSKEERRIAHNLSCKKNYYKGH